MKLLSEQPNKYIKYSSIWNGTDNENNIKITLILDIYIYKKI